MLTDAYSNNVHQLFRTPYTVWNMRFGEATGLEGRNIIRIPIRFPSELASLLLSEQVERFLCFGVLPNVGRAYLDASKISIFKRPSKASRCEMRRFHSGEKCEC